MANVQRQFYLIDLPKVNQEFDNFANSINNINSGYVAGTQTNDSANTGKIGEYKESNQTSTNFPATTVFGDLTSISLTAGDWDVTGSVGATLNGATMTAYSVGISTTTGNSTTGLTYGVNRFDGITPTANGDSAVVVADYRVSLASTTTVYLKYQATFSAGTPKAYGSIRARRMR